MVPLKSLGLDSQRVKKLALKQLHAHSVHNAHKLVQTIRSLEHSPHIQTNQERSAGLSARNPPDPQLLLSLPRPEHDAKLRLGGLMSDNSAEVPSTHRAGGNGGGSSKEELPSLLHTLGVS